MSEGEPGACERSGRRRLPRDVLVLVILAFLVALGFGLVVPVLPLVARSFGVSLTETALLVGGFAAMRMLAAPVSGRVVDRWGEKPALVGGLAAVAVSSLACAAAGSFGQLLAFRIVGGVGSSLFTVASDLLLLEVAGRGAFGRASAAWAGAFLVGSVVGPVLGASLSTWGLRAPFLVYGVLLVVSALVASGALRTGSRPDRPGAAPPGTVTFRAACRASAFRAALVGNFVEGWTAVGIRSVLLPIVVTESLGLEPVWSGVCLTLVAVGTAAGLAVGGRLADGTRRRSSALLGAIVLVATSVWLGATSSLVLVLVLSVASGAGTGLLAPPVNAAVGDVIGIGGSSERAGSAMAGFQMVGDLGAVVGPVAVGALADVAGAGPAFATGAVIATACFAVWWRVADDGGRTKGEIRT